MRKFKRLTASVIAGLALATGTILLPALRNNMLTAKAATRLDDPYYGGYRVYNSCVKYFFIETDPDATSVEFYNESHPDKAYVFPAEAPDHTATPVIPASYDTTQCKIPFDYMRAHNAETDASSGITYLSSIATQNCAYPLTDMATVGTIPTQFDQSGFIWEHGLDRHDTIYYSFVYQGNVYDGNIEVPWLGWNTQYDTITTPDGKEFTLGISTGPNKVSIRTNSNIECEPYKTFFAFSAVKQ